MRRGRGLRFDLFRGIVAKFDGTSTECGKAEGGHPIKAGDRIGYYRPGLGAAHTHCADCWARWEAENREADLLERQGGGAW